MSRVGFELTISVFERAKTVHALDRAASVIGLGNDNHVINLASDRRLGMVEIGQKNRRGIEQ
jgi:hypothetical protein